MKNCAAVQRAASEPFPGCGLAPVASLDAAVGVDVGEDFLDLAVLRTQTPDLEHHRVALAGIEQDPLGVLSARLASCCPDAGPRRLALIDSPRWPRDLNSASRFMAARDPIPAGRILDSALRAMLRSSKRHRAIQLSMFPTPKFAYFTRCVLAPACKPHLRAIYYQLFEAGSPVRVPSDAPTRLEGGIFTRFMLAGFLTFRAWRELGVETLEAYPDLQFRLASADGLMPKRAGAAALAERIRIVKRLRRSLGIDLRRMPAAADQADAEILALSAADAARCGSLAALESPAEGRFLITFNSPSQSSDRPHKRR